MGVSVGVHRLHVSSVILRYGQQQAEERQQASKYYAENQPQQGEATCLSLNDGTFSCAFQTPQAEGDTNIMDAARRIAFALELAAQVKTINVTPRKVDA